MFIWQRIFWLYSRYSRPCSVTSTSNLFSFIRKFDFTCISPSQMSEMQQGAAVNALVLQVVLNPLFSL